MRVIAGSARRLILKTPKGLSTRPTSDKVKETLFNIIQGDLYGVSFLDLFAGSGGIGIEALSRGASSCVFVDDSKEAVKCIMQNLENTGFSEKSKVISTDVLSSMGYLKDLGSFDIIFMDPPYDKGYVKKTLYEISGYGLLKDEGLIIVESLRDEDFSYLGDLGLKENRRKEYKNNMHVFLGRI